MPPRKRRSTAESCRPLGLGTLVIAFDGFRVRQASDRELSVEKDDERWSLAAALRDGRGRVVASALVWPKCDGARDASRFYFCCCAGLNVELFAARGRGDAAQTATAALFACTRAHCAFAGGGAARVRVRLSTDAREIQRVLGPGSLAGFARDSRDGAALQRVNKYLPHRRATL